MQRSEMQRVGKVAIKLRLGGLSSYLAPQAMYSKSSSKGQGKRRSVSGRVKIVGTILDK
jgi:hypothetical protein